MDCIPPEPSDMEDPPLGLTDGGILVPGLSSQGSLVVNVVGKAVFIEGVRWVDFLIFGHSGLSASEETKGGELKIVMILMVLVINYHLPELA